MAYSGMFKLFTGKEPFDIRKSKVDSKATKPAANYSVIASLT